MRPSVSRSGSTISNVLLFRNNIENCETGWSEAISVAANVSDVNIVGNRLDDTGNIAICFAGNYGNAPSGVDYPRNGLVFGNTITNCHCVYDTGFAIYADGTQNVIFSPYLLGTQWLSKTAIPGVDLGDDDMWQVVELPENMKFEDYQKIKDMGWDAWQKQFIAEKCNDNWRKLESSATLASMSARIAGLFSR